MNKNIEKLVKLQGIINKNKFHLCVETDLEEIANWRLYQVFADFNEYMSADNHAILDSKVDSIDDLIKYLENHNGLKIRF